MTPSCSACGATWRGLVPAHCAACHQTFAGVTYFDRHRRNYTCTDPAGFGLVHRDGVWRSPRSRPVELNTPVAA